MIALIKAWGRTARIYAFAGAPHRAYAVAYVSGLRLIRVRWCMRRPSVPL